MICAFCRACPQKRNSRTSANLFLFPYAKGPSIFGGSAALHGPRPVIAVHRNRLSRSRRGRLRVMAGLALDLREFGYEALGIAEVVLPGIGRLAEKRGRIALTEERRGRVEEGRVAPAVGLKLRSGEVALERRLKLLFEAGGVIEGLRSALLEEAFDRRQQVAAIRLADRRQSRVDLFGALGADAGSAAPLLFDLRNHRG